MMLVMLAMARFVFVIMVGSAEFSWHPRVGEWARSSRR